MTGYIDSSTNPMSVLTLGMLDDLGWPVDYDKAEAFILQQDTDGDFKKNAIKLNCKCKF